MSQENVEVVRRIYQEVSARHVLPHELFHPECVTDWTQVSPDFGVLQGVDASQEALASYFETLGMDAVPYGANDYRRTAGVSGLELGDPQEVATRLLRRFLDDFWTAGHDPFP